MKSFFKWLAVAALVILIIVCIDIDFNRTKVFSMNRGQIEVLNLVTAAILLILIYRVLSGRRLNRKRE